MTGDNGLRIAELERKIRERLGGLNQGKDWEWVYYISF